MQCDSGELPVASHWLLPTQEFHYMWENLYYDCDIKNNVSIYINIYIYIRKSFDIFKRYLKHIIIWLYTYPTFVFVYT